MVRDVTLGQYFPAKSVIHRLDPRIKVILTFLPWKQRLYRD